MTIAAAVKSYIDGRGITYDLINHYQTGSSHETAQAAHIDEAHMAKAVILHDNEGAVMVIVPGDTWVSQSAVQQALDRPLVLAEESDATGYFPDCDAGAIPALGPAYGMETLLDNALVSMAFQYIESGDHRTLIKISGRDFLELLSGVRRGRFTSSD